MFLTKSKKSPFYQIIYFENGNRKQVSTKKKSKKEALTYLANFEKNISAEPTIEQITLSEFERRYLSYVEISFSKKYYSIVEHALKLLKENLVNKALLKISNSDIEQFILARFKISKHAASLYHRTLKAAFNSAAINVV